MAMELPPSAAGPAQRGAAADDALESALAATWSAAGVVGCLGLAQRSPRAYQEVPRTVDSLRRHGHLVGVVTPPRRRPVVCVLAIAKKPGASWLTFSFPVAALELVEPRSAAFPFRGSDSLLWRRPLDKWFAAVGRHVHDVLPFELALIGHDVAGMATAAAVGDTPPAERWVGYLVPAGGKLVYHHANR